MKAYSAANVLDAYVGEKQTGFFNWIRSVTESHEVKLELNLPVRFYLRTQMFLDDLQEYSGLEITMDDLIEMLADDILEFYGKNLNPLALKKHFNNLSKLPIVVSSPSHKKQKFKVKISRKIVFKLEMLLCDIAEIYEDHDLKVEEILRLVLLNLLSDIFRGNAEKLVKNISKRLK